MNTEQYHWPTPQPGLGEAQPQRSARRADAALIALLILALSVLATGITVTLRTSAASAGSGQPAVAMVDTAPGTGS